MMKNLLLTVALAAIAVAGNAQSLTAVKAPKTVKTSVENKVMTVSHETTKNFQVSKVSAPKKSPATGVGFSRPEGTLYSEYEFGSSSPYMAALMVPSLCDVKYEHYCTAGNPTWSVGGNEVTSGVDDEGNLTLNYPAVDPSEGYNYTPYYAPTATSNGEDFTLTDLAMVGNDYLPVTHVNPVNVTMYTGFSDGPAWGTNSALESDITEQVSGAEPFGTFQSFEKPASPMSLQSIHTMMWSEQASPLGGKQLTAKLYRVPEEGTLDLDNPEATFICDTDPEMTAFSSGSGYYGQMYFYNYVEDPVLGKTQEAVNIDYPYAILIEGYNQEGVDVRFFLSNQGDDLNELYFATPTRIATRVPAESGTGTQVNYYYWGNTSATTPYMYTMPFGLDVLYDVADVLESGEGSDGTEYSGLNLFHVADDGQSFWYEGDESKTTNVYGVVYTVFPLNDEAGDAQYTFDGCPDWLTLTATVATGDNITEGWSDNTGSYITTVTATAEALPEGVDGRTAKVYVKSDKGAYSSDPLVFAQGKDIASGIQAVATATTKTSARSFNLNGQKVNDKFRGIIIRDGKKVIK